MVDFPFAESLGEDWVAQPTPSPVRIDDFRLHAYSRPELAESSVQMSWRNPDVGGVTRVFRRIAQLVTNELPSGFQALVLPDQDDASSFGWTVIAVKENAYRSDSFEDTDIPAVDESLPKAARRSLGALYSYKIEISGGERNARSSVLSTRIRGINSPRVESVAGVSDTEIYVKWRDNSKLASGFQVRSFDAENGDNEQVITVNGTTKRELLIKGLSPDTRYLVTVRAWDYYGRSSSDSGEARTRPAPEMHPEDKTYTLSLVRQDIYQGNIPYLGRFPTAGNLPSGTLRKVSLNAGWPALFFIKPGRSTDECEDPSAVVRLNPGATLTAAEMTELFGAATPALPIVFVACAQATPTLYNYIPIKITYRST